MAKITRLDGNVLAFASQALTNERTTFGTTNTGDDTLDGNVTADFFRGWGIVGPSDEPTREDFNGLGFTLGQFIAYLHQVGVAEWNANQEYHQNSLANESGVLYLCLTDDHTSATAPSADAVNWEPLITALKTPYDNTDSGLTADNVKEAIDELVATFVSKSIGETFTLDTSKTGVEEPSNSGSAKYIKLTAGEDGAGQYNEGLLTNETITGSGDTIVITAEIADSESPMFGETVNLLNSESRYIQPGETPGQTANDQMQRITGLMQDLWGGDQNDAVSVSGAFSKEGGLSTRGDPATGGTSSVTLDSADSPNARTGTKTNVKHITNVAYMRVR